MASEEGTGRFFIPVFLELVALVCVFEAGDSARAHQFRPATLWFVLGLAFSVIGFAWPRVRERFRPGKATRAEAPPVAEPEPRPKGQLVIPIADLREQLIFSQLQQLQTPPEEKPVGRADWLQLAKDFESCPQQLRADYSRAGSPGVDTWTIGGWSHPDKCRSLCRLAGAMLLSSRTVRFGLSKELKSVTNPTYRWLYFLKERSPLQNYIAGVETFQDGSTAGVYSGLINNLPEVSAAACIECAAKET